MYRCAAQGGFLRRPIPTADHAEFLRATGEESGTAIERDVKRMATDYDAPRKTDDEIAAEGLDGIKEREAAKTQTAVDVDENELAEGLELPGADLSGESLVIHVIPMQANEFTCTKCFLVNHSSRLASGDSAVRVCADCW